MIKVYVASSFLNKDRVREIEGILRDNEMVVTSKWVEHTEKDQSNDIEGLGEDALINLDDQRDADVLLVVLPGRLGTSAELGYGIGIEQSVYVLFDNMSMDVLYPNPMVYLPSVYRLRSLDEFLFRMRMRRQETVRRTMVERTKWMM